jgi:hypothetical protein
VYLVIDDLHLIGLQTKLFILNYWNSCCPTLDLVIAFWVMIYVLHIANLAILYKKYMWQKTTNK